MREGVDLKEPGWEFIIMYAGFVWLWIQISGGLL
jgi:hypothetical protein